MKITLYSVYSILSNIQCVLLQYYAEYNYTYTQPGDLSQIC